MNANTGFFQHPSPSLLVQIGQITESTGRQEVAFDVFDAGLHDPFTVSRELRVVLLIKQKLLF